MYRTNAIDKGVRYSVSLATPDSFKIVKRTNDLGEAYATVGDIQSFTTENNSVAITDEHVTTGSGTIFHETCLKGQWVDSMIQ